MMVNTHWVTAAASPQQSDRNRFYAEATRRLDLPEYQAGNRLDPLDDWVVSGSKNALAELLHGPMPTKCGTFSTVRMADQVAVLDQGRIVETGSHDQLVDAEGRYAELFRLQASHFNRETDPG